MTDADIYAAVSTWPHDGIRFGVTIGQLHVRFDAVKDAANASFLMDREQLDLIEPEAFDGIRVGLEFGLSTSRAAVEIAGGFSRS